MPRDRRTVVFAAVAAGATLAVAVPTFAASRDDRPSLSDVAVADAPAAAAVAAATAATVPTVITAVTVPASTPPTVPASAVTAPTPVTAPTVSSTAVTAPTSSMTVPEAPTSVPVTSPSGSSSSTPTSRDDDDCDDDDRREGDDDCWTGSQGSVPGSTVPVATTETRTVEVPGVVTVQVRRDGTRLTVLAVTVAPGWRITEQEVQADELDLELRGPDRRTADVDIDTDDGRIEVDTWVGDDD